MRRLTLAVCVLAALCICADAQTGTDFSGNWVLEEGIQRSATVPQRLVVQQPITTTTMRGAPMPPAYLWLIVERQFADHAQKDSYNIGVIGGNVGGVTGNGIAAVQRRWAVVWVGNSLRMEWRNLTASGSTTSSRTEVWRLDQGRRLVIAIEDQEGDTVTAQTLYYRKEDAPPLP
jgi:hypothetical protein